MGVTVTTSSTAEPSAGGTSELDARVERLASHAGHWASSTIARRIGYLEELRRRTYAAADGWTAAACEAKGLAPYADVAGEEWGAGPWALLYSLNRYLDSLQRLEKQGRVEISPRMVRTRPDGQVVARVFPENSIDQFLLNGVQAEIWLEPGATAPEISDHVAGAYRGGRPSGRVALVLGAGNVSSIPPLDVLLDEASTARAILGRRAPRAAALEAAP